MSIKNTASISYNSIISFNPDKNESYELYFDI